MLYEHSMCTKLLERDRNFEIVAKLPALVLLLFHFFLVLAVRRGIFINMLLRPYSIHAVLYKSNIMRCSSLTLPLPSNIIILSYSSSLAIVDLS